MPCTREEIKAIYPDLDHINVDEALVNTFVITPSYKLEQHIDVSEVMGIVMKWVAVYDDHHRRWRSGSKRQHMRKEIPLVEAHFEHAEGGQYILATGYDYRFGHNLTLSGLDRAEKHIRRKHENIKHALGVLARTCNVMFPEATELEIYFRTRQLANLPDDKQRALHRAHGSLVKRLMDLYPDAYLPKEVVALRQLAKQPPPRPQKAAMRGRPNLKLVPKEPK